MLVDLVELFSCGVKRPRDEVRASVPLRGHLNIDKMWTHQDVDRAPVHAHLDPPRIESLYRCRLVYWRGRNVVLSGVQRGPVPGRRKAEQEYVQMWWCKIVQ